MTTTCSLSRTGAGNPYHWLTTDPTGSLNRTGTDQKFCTGEIRVSVITMLGVLSSPDMAGLGGGLTAATSITGPVGESSVTSYW